MGLAQIQGLVKTCIDELTHASLSNLFSEFQNLPSNQCMYLLKYHCQILGHTSMSLEVLGQISI